MNLKKIKIILSNKLIIFSFVFLSISFLQVKQADADCYWINTDKKTCKEISEKFTTDRADSYCTYIKKPSIDFSCCCEPAPTVPSKINATMPNWKIPDIKLQIPIPGLNLTKGANILANCEKDEKGNPTRCSFPWIGEYVAGIYKYAIGIVGILAAVVLMIGGVIWITAGGNASRIGEAKAWIAASLSGLVIALCSYTILYYVNPSLVNFNPLGIKIVEKILLSEQLIDQSNFKSGILANQYKAMDCKNLKEGDKDNFFITSYCKPLRSEFSSDGAFLCAVALNCWCPNNNKRDTSKTCSGSVEPWNPCLSFEGDYCDKTKSGSTPTVGTIAADISCFPFGSIIAINGKDYTVKDTGSAIKGKRIDIWSEGCKNLPMTGVANVTIKSK